MKSNEMERVGVEIEEKGSNILLGLIGSILGALIGAAIWIGVYQLGIIASIAGIAIVYLSCKGYQLLGRSQAMVGVVLSIGVSVAVLILAQFLCWGWDIYTVFVVEYDITLWEAILSVPEIAFTEDFVVDFVKEMLIGLICIGVGATPFLRQAKHRKTREIEG